MNFQQRFEAIRGDMAGEGLDLLLGFHDGTHFGGSLNAMMMLSGFRSMGDAVALVERRLDWKPLFYISVGVGLGMLINPYFPANIIFSYRHMLPKLADATSVRFTRNPQGLVSALRKLESARTPLANANRAVQHLFIVNPLSGGGMDSLFATHPSMANRIHRLRDQLHRA